MYCTNLITARPLFAGERVGVRGLAERLAERSAAVAMLTYAAIVAAMLCAFAGDSPSWASDTGNGSATAAIAEAPAIENDTAIQLDPRLEEAERRRIAAVERALPATVSIFVPGGGGGGSGVLISPDGYALTNFHVTSPAGTYMRCGLSDGRIYDAVIIGIDPVGDLALIRLLGRDDFPYAEMANSRQATVGQWCMVIGNPFLLATNLQPSVSWGILSGVGRYQYPAGTLLEYADCLQTDASINPGNSGGPLFDDSGRLLGIVGRASFEKRGRVNVGVGYAISINQAKNFLGDLHSGRILDHATLGATVSTDADGGARVSNILQSSDAYRRGLRYGHTIVEIDGRSVNTANEVQNVLATLPPQWRVKLDYLDQGERKSTLVRLANLHGFDELLTKMAAALPPPPPVPDAPKDGDGSDQPEGSGDAEGEPSGGRPPRGAESATAIPEAVAQLYEARRGYANYQPNRLKQQDMVAALRRQFPHVENASGDTVAEGTAAEGAESTASAVWRVEGVSDDDAAVPVKVLVGDDGYSLIVGERTIQATKAAELYDGILAGNASGMLACLDAWRALVVQGPAGYGDCYYRGQVPLLGQRPLRDCLIGVAGELEAAWLMHPDSEALEIIEVTADRDADPAELLVTWGDDPAAPPTHLELRDGTQSLLKMRVDTWRIGADAEVQE